MEVDTNSTDHITASGATDAPQVTAVVSKKRNPCNKSFKLTLGASNVRTTNDSDDSIRPERATAIIGIDICALSEVRRPGIGNTIKRSHSIFWSGSDKREAGVGFAVSNSLLSQFRVNSKLTDQRQTFHTRFKARRRLSPNPHQRLRSHDAKNAGGKGKVSRKSSRMRR